LQSAVSQVFNLPTAAREQRSADSKSAIRQIKNLRYAKDIPDSLVRELVDIDSRTSCPRSDSLSITTEGAPPDYTANQKHFGAATHVWCPRFSVFGAAPTP
jgi:hypothetical protein